MKVRSIAKPKIPQIAPGIYPAVCIGVIGLGEQYSELYKNYSNKVLFLFELPDELMQVDGEEKPRWASREFTGSRSKKSKLFEFIGSWNGKQYTTESFGEVDLFDQIGKPCQLQMVASESGEYTNIASAVQLPKGMTVERKQTDTYAFDANEWDDAVFESLPEWIREKIMRSTEYQKKHAPTDEVDIPAETVEVPQRATGEAEVPF